MFKIGDQVLIPRTTAWNPRIRYLQATITAISVDLARVIDANGTEHIVLLERIKHGNQKKGNGHDRNRR